jgi:hypothetical protein
LLRNLPVEPVGKTPLTGPLACVAAAIALRKPGHEAART